MTTSATTPLRTISYAMTGDVVIGSDQRNAIDVAFTDVRRNPLGAMAGATVETEPSPDHGFTSTNEVARATAAAPAASATPRRRRAGGGAAGEAAGADGRAGAGG